MSPNQKVMTSAFFVIIFFVKNGESQTHFHSQVMSLGLNSYGRVACISESLENLIGKLIHVPVLYM